MTRSKHILVAQNIFYELKLRQHGIKQIIRLRVEDSWESNNIILEGCDHCCLFFNL